jgi:hypothetical protein
MKIFKTAISSMLLTSLLTTGIVSGQAASGNKKQSVQSQQQAVMQTSSNYVVNLNEPLETIRFSAAECFEQEVKHLEDELAERAKDGTIIVDRHAV